MQYIHLVYNKLLFEIAFFCVFLSIPNRFIGVISPSHHALKIQNCAEHLLLNNIIFINIILLNEFNFEKMNF